MKSEKKRGGAKRRTRERIMDGLGVSLGIAIGPAHVMEAGSVDIPEYTVDEDKLPAELRRFADAVEKSQRQLRKLKTKSADLPGAAAEELGFLLDARLQMLTGSRVVRGVEKRIAETRANAEAAVRAEITEVANSFAQLEDAYLAARADDIREVGDRLIRNLTKSPYQAFSKLPEGSIIIAEELSPADTALMDPAHVGGFATAIGGSESHTAIMARSLGLPAVLGLAQLVVEVQVGDIVIIDGSAGRVIIRPKPAGSSDDRSGSSPSTSKPSAAPKSSSLPSITSTYRAISLFTSMALVVPPISCQSDGRKFRS
jgi:phosphotransferase system enzyme I (PtsI)